MDDTRAVVTKKIKPNFRALSQRYSTQMQPLCQAIAQLTQDDIQVLEKEQALALTIPITVSSQKTTKVVLTPAEVIITSEDIAGWSVATEGEITVALDTTLNDALRQEGLARDLVNRIQNMRKDQGLAIQDKIKVAIATESLLVVEAIQKHKDYICRETQALQFEAAQTIVGNKLIDLDGHEVQINITLQQSSS